MPGGMKSKGPERRAAAARAMLLALLAGGAWPGAAALAQEPAYAPDEVKAAFLYHFGAFVEWPPGAEPEDAITIAVLGDRDVAAELETMLPGRTVHKRPVQVREIRSIDELGDAQILFIGAEVSGDLSRLLDAVRNRPVLTVTESNGALDRGSVINFALVDQRVRFEISLPAARMAGLELSSRLLGIALRVEQSSGLHYPPRAQLAALRAVVRGSS